MNNTLIIAKKEFLDMISSKLVIIIVLFYMITFFLSFLTILSMSESPSLAINPIELTLINFKQSSCYYGVLLGLVLGFGAFYSEVHDKAINTLLLKPVYRDTIINGKIIGTLGFLLLLLSFASILNSAIIIIFFGSNAIPFISSFINSIPLWLFISTLCILLGYSLSILLYIIFKTPLFSLFLGFLFWIFFFYLMGNLWIAGYIGYFFNDDSICQTVCELAPYTIIGNIMTNRTIQDTITYSGFELVKLFLYSFIILFISYTIFLRSDIS